MRVTDILSQDTILVNPILLLSMILVVAIAGFLCGIAYSDIPEYNGDASEG